MNKRIALLLIIFLSLPYLVNSTSKFVIQETEKISLQPNVDDPDADVLEITYDSPLDEEGVWQTTYGDAGEYEVTITVSDGETSTSEDVLIIVEKKEEQPVIESFIPKQGSLSIDEAESIDFRVLASDLNNDELSYEWFLDGEKVQDGQEFSYDTTYNDAGKHKISADVSDESATISLDWNVDVENVDVEELFDGINDITIDENEIASLNIPDFEEYGLIHSISEPIGNENKWQTSYEDAGEYAVKIHTEGKGFSDDKIVTVIVNDVDRAPVFEATENRVLNEDEELEIILSADDPDGDEITYSVNNLPEGAEFDEDTLIWTPGFDTVLKKGFINLILSKFMTLRKNFNVEFIAPSKVQEQPLD